MEQLYCHTFTT